MRQHENLVFCTPPFTGPNRGREFYTCSKLYDDSEKCSFFEWADTSSGVNLSLNNTQSENSAGVVCNCNMAARKQTVRKEGMYPLKTD